MREIKFRAWDGEQMIDTFSVQSNGDGINYRGNIMTSWKLMQYTGLTDKNGKEIYEGDLVKANWLAELGITELDCTGVGIVEWDENNPCFYLHLIKPYKSGIQQDMTYEETDLPIFNDGYNERCSFEIIGNVFEQSYLLAGQIVWLDKDLANHSKVEVVEQTPMRLFTVVRSLDSGYTWNVMSYRLTPCT